MCNYIENLRYDRDITQEELVFGVCDIRTYKRYRTGTHKIPLQVLLGFSNKLEINLVSMLSDFEKAKQQETEMLNNLYNSIADASSNTEELINRLEKVKIIDQENQLYFDYSLLLYQFSQKRLSQHEFLTKLLSLIRYEKMMRKKKYTDVEVLILGSLLDYEGKYNRKDIVIKLEGLIHNQENNFVCKNAKYVSPVILMRLSKYYGANGDYHLVKKYCQMGIEILTKTRSSYLVEYFYYYLALANYKTNNVKEFEQNLFQTFNSIYLHGNDSKQEKFLKLILSDFHLNYSQFMNEYLSKSEFSDIS